MFTCIIYYYTSTSTHSDIIYKTEGSNNDDGDKGGSDKNNGANEEEESFELEEEIAHIEKLMRKSNDAMILDEKLPDSAKEKNSHLNDLRKDPHVKEFFEGKTPNVSDLGELNKALVESREEKIIELYEAKNNANDESSTNSLRDQSNSSLHESDNTLNKKERIEHIEKLMRKSNDAMILDEKLPDSAKEKNSHLNDLRKDPHVKEFFEGKTPNVSDLGKLNKSLVEARKELSEAKNNANNESSTNSLRDQSNSSLHESDNTLNKKEDNNNYSEYKILPGLLGFILELINNLFN
jgi:hypothetical protein